MDKEYRQIVGKQLRVLRVQQNLSQLELARMARIAANQVSKIERGVLNFTIDTLKKIADALGVSMSDILGDL